ncbi:hypothetical protein ULMS_18660 [Patiriisocius marinistellae]|uniref:Uncharacterized protein n=1 Tax=Patiriisocius marinistellae TaxID=2494560 RepID=A0A5J4FYB0_9FLAO|nr:hypothetical protein [Patiriisocius marinistellae]GEQ86358.1 hypothetical protein ULMS_18660 [Patiriisocius marinistellae]
MHETLHAISLPHTFDNKGTYTYQKGQTYNIMDYSHQTTYGSKDRINTWLWQWEQLHKHVDME